MLVSVLEQPIQVIIRELNVSSDNEMEPSFAQNFVIVKFQSAKVHLNQQCNLMVQGQKVRDVTEHF